MKIIWDKPHIEPTLRLALLNEAYFRFTNTTLRRVDCQGENNMSTLSEEQAILFQKLCTLQEKNRPVLKKVHFDKCYILIELINPWNNKLQHAVETMIKESWPMFFTA